MQPQPEVAEQLRHKLWAERRWLASPRDYGDGDETGWRIDMTSPDKRLIENKDVLNPQASVAGSWADNGNAWSAILGAIGGAGTVLFIALLVLIWRKPRRRELPMLAPMDVAQN
ncbi:tRNA (Uracil-5-)-methyltransferase family protein, partial [Operophtera brumata]